MEKQNRRAFLKKSLTILGALPVALSLSGQHESALAQTDPTVPVDPAAQVPAMLGYQHDTTKVDGSKFPTHSPTKICAGCQLYTKGGIKIAGDSGEWGICQIFPTNLVNAKGWCQSFVPKA